MQPQSRGTYYTSPSSSSRPHRGRAPAVTCEADSHYTPSSIPGPWPSLSDHRGSTQANAVQPEPTGHHTEHQSSHDHETYVIRKYKILRIHFGNAVTVELTSS